MNKPENVIDGIEKQTIKTLESLGFWWGNSPVSTEKQLTNVINDTYMRLSEIKEDGSMSFLFESIGEFPSAWWQTLTMDEVREMVREIDGDAIGAIKEYLQWRHDEVYSTELFPPPDYDDVKDKIGETELTRLSADISRRNASSILDWINENTETEQTRTAPHPDVPIEEIAAYLTEKNRELYQRLADGYKRKPQKKIIDIADSELLFLLGEETNSQKYHIDRNINMGNGEISVNSGDWKWGDCHICLTVKDGILVEAWGEPFEDNPISTVAKIVRMGYEVMGFYHKADAPITPEFLEGLGFEENASTKEYILWASDEENHIGVILPAYDYPLSVNQYSGDTIVMELPHIRTQQQLVSLVAALFGGGE